jgi:hypothetical protein
MADLGGYNPQDSLIKSVAGNITPMSGGGMVGGADEIKDIKLFSNLSKTHKKGKKSFVLVASAIDFNAVPTQLTVVPSVQEAHDIIEMEEIERDLGF